MYRFKTYFKSILKDDFINATFFSAISSVIKILTSLIIGKFVAVYVGVQGFALFGQLLNFVLIATILTGGGLLNGMTKYVAEYNTQSVEKLPIMLSTSIKFISYISIFTGIFISIFSSQISKLILYDESFWLIFFIFGITIIFYSLNSFLLSIVNGFKKFETFNKLNIILNIVNLIFTIILVYSFKLNGVLYSVVIIPSFSFFLTLFLLKEEKWLSYFKFNIPFNTSIFRNLLAFAGMGIITSSIAPISTLLIRQKIIDELTLQNAGIYEFVFRVVTSVLMFFSITISTYFLPRISEIRGIHELKKEVNKAYLISIPILFLLLLSVYLFRRTIITLLGNEDFISAQGLFLYPLIGVFFRVCSQIMGFVFVAKAFLKEVIIIEVIYNLILVSTSIYLLHVNNLEGVMFAYLFSNVLYFLMLWLAYKFIRKKLF